MLVRVAQEVERAERQRLRNVRQQRLAASSFNSAQQRAQEQYYAQLEVEEFESTIAALTSVHRECSQCVDWRAMAQHQPVIDQSWSQRLRGELATFEPTVWERLWKSSARRDELLRQLQSAEATERTAWDEAVQQSNQIRHLAARVLSGDPNAYEQAVQETGCLDELAEYACLYKGGCIDTETAWVSLKVDGPEMVPAESKSLTASGKLSTKRLPAARQMEIYQDFVCGIALRAARELTAVLPLRSVFCDVTAPVFDSRTGKYVHVVVLSMHCPAPAISPLRIDFSRVDASDLVSSMRHQMKLSRGKGFQPVESISPVRSLSASYG